MDLSGNCSNTCHLYIYTYQIDQTNVCKLNCGHKTDNTSTNELERTNKRSPAERPSLSLRSLQSSTCCHRLAPCGPLPSAHQSAIDGLSSEKMRNKQISRMEHAPCATGAVGLPSHGRHHRPCRYWCWVECTANPTTPCEQRMRTCRRR